MSTFKFKGVQKGKNSGDIIEYSAEEKVPVALQMAVAAYEPYKKDYLTAVNDVKISSLNFSPKGELLRKMWQHNVYTAEGTAVFKMRHLHKDMMLKPHVKNFKIKFEDGLNHLSLPEINIVELEID